jgi:hypothetical protein
MSNAAIVKVTLASESNGDFTFVIPVSSEDYLKFKESDQKILENLETKVNDDVDCYSNLFVTIHNTPLDFEEAVRTVSILPSFGGPSNTIDVLEESILTYVKYTIDDSRKALTAIVDAAKAALAEETGDKAYKKFDEIMIG